MKVRSALADQFTAYNGVLWGVLGALARSGFVVRPGEAHDLIHDFFVDAWQGLTERFDRRTGEFAPYVSVSFYRFARRRIIKEEALTRRLVDLELLEREPSFWVTATELAERRQGVAVLRQLIGELPEVERVVLTEFLREPHCGERELAARHSMTRYELRESLGDAVGMIAARLAGSAAKHDRDLYVATLIWGKGYPTRVVANELGISVAEVQSARLRIVSGLLASVRDIGGGREHRKESMNDQQFLRLLRSALTSVEDTGILAQVRAHADQIQGALDRGDVELDESEWVRVRENRAWVAKVYGALAGTSDEAEAESFALTVANDVRGREEKEIGEAFRCLIGNLPESYLNWEKRFESAPLADESWREFLRRSVSVEEAGESAEGLLQFGIAPAMVFGATRGLQLQFDSIALRGSGETSPGRELVASLEVPSEDPPPRLRLIPIFQEQAVAAVAGTPGLPVSTELPLTRWLFEVAELCPFIVGGYRVRQAGRRPLAFTSDSTWRNNGLDLVRRWSVTE